MNEPDLELLLARARRALSPRDGDVLRVEGALQAKLLSAPVDATLAPAHAPLRWWHATAGVALLGVGGAVGYSWGYRDGSTALATPVVATAVPPVRALQTPREPTPVSVAPSAVPDRLPPLPVHASAPRASVVASGPPAPGLDEEVRQLRRIERALRDGNPRLALAIGEDLDAVLPQGQLRLERSAAQLMAQCQLGDEQAVQQARRFVSDNAQSAYTARLRQICKL